MLLRRFLRLIRRRRRRLILLDRWLVLRRRRLAVLLLRRRLLKSRLIGRRGRLRLLPVLWRRRLLRILRRGLGVILLRWRRLVLLRRRCLRLLPILLRRSLLRDVLRLLRRWRAVVRRGQLRLKGLGLVLLRRGGGNRFRRRRETKRTLRLRWRHFVSAAGTHPIKHISSLYTKRNSLVH